MEYQSIHNQAYTDLRPWPESSDGISLTGQNVGYRQLLTPYRLSISDRPPYLLTGALPASAGWLIHISIVQQQVPEPFVAFLGFLAGAELTFVIPAGPDQHAEILDGRSGLVNTGKVVTVYLPDDKHIVGIVGEIIRLTAGFKGPVIPTAINLAGCVYVQYGRLFEQTEFFGNKHYSQIYGFNAENALIEQLRFHDIGWPFDPIKKLSKRRFKRFLQRQYLPLRVLKIDPKGDVLKCIQLRKLYNMRYCVVKQGRRFQCFDDTGRDTSDRLLWQYKAHKLLEPEEIVPKALDFFEFGNNYYLVLEYVEGISLNEKIAGLQQGTMWKFLETGRKREVLNYLHRILDILESFHKNGLVHRDVTPGNFLIKEDGKVVAIDIELSYHCAGQEPSPAFALGTPGYMSPQQFNRECPSFEEDIYSFGSLMIKVFTGLSPGKVARDDLPLLYEDLIFLPGIRVGC